jgi:hypothetical protein
MKFRVNSPEHSEQIQKKLFEMGYKWSLNGAVVEKADADYLWAGSFGDNCITYCYGDEDYFNNHQAEEYILTPLGTFAKVADYYKQPETKADKIEQDILDKHLPPGDYTQVLFTAGDSLVERNFTVEPPLGLKPKKVHDEERLIEIVDAMYRYVSAGHTIPAEWFAEAQFLNGQMEGK